MTQDEVQQLIERGIAGARATVKDTTGGGDHFDAVVVSPAFEGLGLVQRHQRVYGALGDAMHARIHALALKTYTPGEYDAAFSKTRA